MFVKELLSRRSFGNFAGATEVEVVCQFEPNEFDSPRNFHDRLLVNYVVTGECDDNGNWSEGNTRYDESGGGECIADLPARVRASLLRQARHLIRLQNDS